MSPGVLRLLDMRRAKRQHPEAIARQRRARLADITRLLAGHGLGYVAVEHGEEPRQQSAGGKVREVIPLRREEEDRCPAPSRATRASMPRSP